MEDLQFRTRIDRGEELGLYGIDNQQTDYLCGSKYSNERGSKRAYQTAELEAKTETFE